MRLNSSLVQISLGTLVSLFSLSARAADDTNTGAPGMETAPAADSMEDQALSSQDFLQRLHVVNQAEIKEGLLLIARSDDKQVQQYAQVIVRDHILADTLVRAAAQRKGISLDSNMLVDQANALQQRLDEGMQQLEAAPAENLREVLAPMAIEDHQASLDLLNKAQADIDDNTVRILAFIVEPFIRNHLRLAREF